MTTPDASLLYEYSQGRREEPFVELVRRHVDLVYATALRQVRGDTHLAQDVTQTVFADLARKAASLTQHHTIAGWLYSNTRFAAAQAIRSGDRRLGKEHEAVALQAPSPTGYGHRAELDRWLDDAMDGLEELDRESVLLRYFKGLDLRSVGAALGVSEEAARKCVDRAAEQLRKNLALHGIDSTAPIGTILSASSLVTAPVGLPAAIAKAVSVSPGITGVAQFSPRQAASQLKTVLTWVLVVAAVTSVLIQQRLRMKLATENQQLRERIRRQTPPQPGQGSANAFVNPAELERLRKDQIELMRLRAEIKTLRRSESALAEADETAHAPLESKPDIESPVIRYSASAVARLTSGQTLLMGGWTVASGRRALLLVTPEASLMAQSEPQVTFHTVWLEAPEDTLEGLGLDKVLTDTRTNALSSVLTESQRIEALRVLSDSPGVEVLTAPKIITKEGMPARVDVTQTKMRSGESFQVGPSVDLVSIISLDGVIELTVHASLNELPRIEEDPEANEPP